MPDLIPRAAFALGCWGGLFLVFLGMGLCVLRFVFGEGVSPRRALTAAWVGWAMSLLLLEWIHLFLPVAEGAQLLLLALGCAGLWLSRRELRQLWRESLAGMAQRRTMLRLPFVALLILIVAALAVAPDLDYDSGNYHQQSVLWASHHPAVPGLGNLHVRLALFSSLHLYFAALSSGLLAGLAVHPGNGFLLALCLVSLVERGWPFVRWTTQGGLVSTLMLPGLLAFAQPLQVASLGTDLAVGLVETMMVLLLLDLASSAREGEDAFIALTVLAGAAITIKLSALPFASAALLAGVGFRFARPGGEAPSRRALGVAGGLLALTLVAGLVHTVVLSGYPLFPNPALPLPVNWRIPGKTVEELEGWIRAWARLVNDNSMSHDKEAILGGWIWFPDWARRLATLRWGFGVPVAMAVAGVIASFLALLRKSGRERWRAGLRETLLAFTSCAAALGAWFLLAPDLRFAWCLLWLLGALVLAVGLASWADRWRHGAAAVVAVVALGLVLKTAENAWWWWRSHGGTEPSPPVLAESHTNSGLVLFVPVSGEQCFATALLCTPYPSAALRLRRPGDLGGGFAIEPFREEEIVGWWTRERPWWEMKSGP